jgi:hypothetical protein
VGGALRAAGVLSRAQHKTQRHLFGMEASLCMNHPLAACFCFRHAAKLKSAEYILSMCAAAAAAARAQRPPSVFFFILLRPKSARRCVFVLLLTPQQRVCVCICVHGFKAIASDREYKTAELINVVVVVARAASAVAAAG